MGPIWGDDGVIFCCHPSMSDGSFVLRSMRPVWGDEGVVLSSSEHECWWFYVALDEAHLG